MASDLNFLPAAEIARLVRNRDVTASEVLEAHLRRIELANPALHAIVQLDAEGARRAAAAADAVAGRGGDEGPLCGVPFTAKDWLETEGLICAAGFPERRDYRPKRDATAVARMRRAGAVLLGKANVSDGSPVYERPNNPYDTERSPGASSSGDCVAVAAGMAAIGVGSDSGGSLRLPAHFCGVATIKPTTGRVPLTGHFPRIGDMSDPRTVIGPIARSAADLWPALQAIAGPDFRDPGTVPMPIDRGPRNVNVAGLRIATYTEMHDQPVTPETATAVRGAAASLAAAGAQIEEAMPPRIDEALAITRAYWARISSASWSEWVPGREHGLASADAVEQSIFAWERLRRAFLTFMERFDLIVCPVAPGPAVEHRALRDVDYVYTLPYSLTGYPCAVVRAGTSPEGLPIGVQVVARPWREDVAIASAMIVEQALGGWKRPGV